MAKEFYKTLSEKLKIAKEELEKSKRVKAQEEEEIEETAPERPLIIERMQAMQIPQMPLFAPRVLEQPQILVAPQAQAPLIAPTVGPAKPSIVSEEAVTEKVGYLELEGEAPATIKYKPISLEVPEEFEVSGKAVVAKEYIQKLKKVDYKFPLITMTIKDQSIAICFS